MELIRINENKIKIMLNAADMDIYALPSDGLDYCESTVKEAFRAVLREAGRQTGVDFTDGRLSIQLYPSRDGGCEMFVTRSEVCQGSVSSPKTKSHSDATHRKSGTCGEREIRWELSEAFGFDSMKWLLSVCKQLKRIGFHGFSAAFRDEKDRCFLVLEACGKLRPLIMEYGTEENPEAVRLYISEHGHPICTKHAVETLGALL